MLSLRISLARVVCAGLTVGVVGSARAQEIPAPATGETPGARAAEPHRAVQTAALRLAEEWQAMLAQERVGPCHADGSPWLAVEGLSDRARAIAALGAAEDDQFEAWTQAHKLRYGIEIARSGTACDGPQRVPMIEPSAAEALIEAADALIAELGRDRRTIDYSTLPPVPIRLDPVLEDLVDVFEANFQESFGPGPTDGKPQAPAQSELRRLVYVPVVTPRRFTSEVIEPLRALVTALEAAEIWPPEKRDMLLLKAHLALELAEYLGRYTGC